MKNNSREEMIKVTALLLQTKGYFGTGLNEIIAKSGAPRGSIYYHFPNGKEQLVIEAIEWTRENVTRFISEKLSLYNDPVEALQNYILDSADRFEQDKYFQGVPITAIVLETSDISDNLREACKKVFDSWHQVIADKLLNNGYEEKIAYDLAMALNAIIQGSLVICLTQKNADPLRKVSNFVPLLLKINNA